MKLRPIQRRDVDAATILLSEGFPLHARKNWLESLRHLLPLAEQEGDGSVGHIASAGGQDVGICLSIPSMRFAYEPAPRKVVNLAGFYMRPGNEWMTTLFMRRIVRDPSVEYVDLTASESMRQVIRHLGFRDRTSGMVVVPTLTAALQPARGVRILPTTQLSPGRVLEDHLSLLDRHASLGAISLVVKVAGTCHPLILARGRRKRLGSARILLARDRALLCAIAGPLARHLLSRGIAFLEFDSPTPMPIAGSLFVASAAPVQSTWPIASAAIDHTFSELVFIPPPSQRQVLANPFRRSNPALPFPFGLVDASITAAPSAGLVLGLAEMMPL